MAPLSSDLRALLERAIIKAREVAEKAASAAITALAVQSKDAPTFLSDEQRRLRVALRAKARQLNEDKGEQDTGYDLLIEEIAYEQWHGRFFARFLAENNLLMHPKEAIAVTLEECKELALDKGAVDGWQLAARYANVMLPGIFRVDDPAIQVQFAPEGRHELERIITELPSILFCADDTLGWSYQFWQTKKKEQVNRSGKKVGGANLSPVTQLFTEHYMVQFLLENSLGAWWAARHPASPLLEQFTYLRFTADGLPAAGTFPGWPTRIAKVTVMDPCCGSGHFLVAAFEMLYQMRMEEEGLSQADAANAVLRDNLYGLELDKRCTQIAAFALALAAWKAGGYRQLPIPNIACSGIPVAGQLETWTTLAGDDEHLRVTLERLYELFRNAPDLGSLINPGEAPMQKRLFESDYKRVEPLLKLALAKERKKDDPIAVVFGAAAEGVAEATMLLARTYTLVITNVPFQGFKKLEAQLKLFCEQHHPNAKMNLATIFLERCRMFASSGGSYATVTPQNWFSLGSYSKLRRRLLTEQTWNFIVNLGIKAFQTQMWDFNIGLSILTNHNPTQNHTMVGVDVSTSKTIVEKAKLLREQQLQAIEQKDQLDNPDMRITLEKATQIKLLQQYAFSPRGIVTGDTEFWIRCFWELPLPSRTWRFLQSTVESNHAFDGREHIINWFSYGKGMLRPGIANLAYDHKGVVISQMGNLSCTLYTGELYDNNCTVIVPQDLKYLPAIWAYCQSSNFRAEVRRIDQKTNVTNATMVKVPFDLDYWHRVAVEAGPLPEPYSNDPTQWLFNGNPIETLEHTLQVAVARLLGYRWPQQKADVLDNYPDKDSIVCLVPVVGKETAVERLRALLALAYGEDWSAAQQESLLTSVGYGGKNLEQWLHDGFFAQHCRLFHNRPFIWQIWDGLADGFSALVNYHHLDMACLEKLIYSYLGPWIMTQKAAQVAGDAGAERRLLAAQVLQKKLQAIGDGEDPYDIYVRWKPLHEQPIGWYPDLNDGVRLNIRPFVEAGVLRSRFTINWHKDRGTNPDGTERHNDVHKKIAEKRIARQTTIQWI